MTSLSGMDGCGTVRKPSRRATTVLGSSPASSSASICNTSPILPITRTEVRSGSPRYGFIWNWISGCSCAACADRRCILEPVDLPSRKYLNLAAIKTMVAAAEAEATKRGVQVTLCIVDEGGNVLFLQKADGLGLNTIQFAQKKARYSALYRRASKVAADQLKNGDLQ